MLVLSRKAEQRIRIGDDIEIVVLSIDGAHVKIGIQAPRHIPVLRWELLEDVQEENRRAAAAAAAQLPFGSVLQGIAQLGHGAPFGGPAPVGQARPLASHAPQGLAPPAGADASTASTARPVARSGKPDGGRTVVA